MWLLSQSVREEVKPTYIISNLLSLTDVSATDQSWKSLETQRITSDLTWD